MKIRASDYGTLSGQSSYDIDIPERCEVFADMRGDNAFRVYAVGPKTVVPLFRGDHWRFKGVLEGFTCLQVCTSGALDCIGYNVTSAALREGQKVDPVSVVIPLSDSNADLGLSRVVQMMVRQQLRAAGFDPDGDEKDFGDGDMSFDDGDDEFGPVEYDDDDEFVQLAEPDRGPPSIPSNGAVPPPSGEPPASPET